MHKTWKSFTAATVGVAAAALVLAGCGSSPAGGDSSSTTATGTPIEVAAMATLTLFPEAPPAAQAVFDEYNAQGGFNGHPIEFTIYDDQSDPATSATAAQQIISSDAVGMAATSSVFDCELNHETWEQNGLVSIPALGVDTYCYTSPNISGVDAGPYYSTFATLSYGSEELGLDRICALLVEATPTTVDGINQAIDAWTEATGKELAYADRSVTYGQQSYAANISSLKSQDCDAIFSTDIAPDVLAILGEAANQGVDLPVLGLTSILSDEFALANTYTSPIYVPATWAPYFDTSLEGVSDWQELMTSAGVPLTAFAQGGYIAAKSFIAVLETIDGDVTRESFTAAAQAMADSVPSPLGQFDWTFGSGETHASNTTSYEVVLEAGSTSWSSLGPLFDGAENGWIPTVSP